MRGLGFRLGGGGFPVENKGKGEGAGRAGGWGLSKLMDGGRTGSDAVRRHRRCAGLVAHRKCPEEHRETAMQAAHLLLC